MMTGNEVDTEAKAIIQKKLDQRRIAQAERFLARIARMKEAEKVAHKDRIRVEEQYMEFLAQPIETVEDYLDADLDDEWVVPKKRSRAALRYGRTCYREGR